MTIRQVSFPQPKPKPLFPHRIVWTPDVRAREKKSWGRLLRREGVEWGRALGSVANELFTIHPGLKKLNKKKRRRRGRDKYCDRCLTVLRSKSSNRWPNRRVVAAPRN